MDDCDSGPWCGALQAGGPEQLRHEPTATLIADLADRSIVFPPPGQPAAEQRIIVGKSASEFGAREDQQTGDLSTARKHHSSIVSPAHVLGALWRHSHSLPP